MVGLKNFNVEEDIRTQVEELVKETTENSRYLSFEYCFKFFQEEFFNNNEVNLNNAALNLACYLSSWGMYRGSTFALQNNYKIYEDLLQSLHKNPELNPYTPLDYDIQAINEYFVTIKDSFMRIKFKEEKVTLTPTFATKIMLGIYGITPAFDRFFIEGLREFNKKNGKSRFICSHFKNVEKFENCYKEIQTFYNEYQQIIDTLSNENNKIIKIPPMRIIDMYFWKLGKSVSKNKKQLVCSRCNDKKRHKIKYCKYCGKELNKE